MASPLILVLLFIFSVVCAATSTTHTELPRKWSIDRRSTQSPLMDPCQKERSMKMICHCEYEDKKAEEKSVKSAECWILKSDFTAHDLLWRAFDRYHGITDIQFIVQSSGSLNFLPTAVFANLINLSQVSVSYSSIAEIGAFAFANSSSLRTVRLNHNNVTGLGRFAFANHRQLERIDLQENELRTIHRDSFVNLTKLEYLALNTNKLMEVPSGAFRELNNLNELQLQNNLIAAISPEIFTKLENLRVLKLSSNRIKFVGNGAFIELWSLQELYLDNNLIEGISNRAFDGLNSLRKLSLQKNRLRVLEQTLFVSLPVLSSLNLSENRLKTLHRSAFPDTDNFLTPDSTLILTGNDFLCDCKLHWLMELRNRTMSIATQKSLDRLRCLLTDPNRIPEGLLWNTIEQQEPSDSDYISDEKVVTADPALESSVDLSEGALVNLFLVDQLPCSQDESDPTSLPLPRESTGFRDSGISRQTPLAAVTVIIFSAFVTLVIT